MTSYLAQRLLLMIPTFIGITLIGFLIMRLAPGDPAELRAAGGLGAAGGAGISLEKRGAVDEAMAQWRAQYGLDKPLHVQYLVWLQNLFTLKFGDFKLGGIGTATFGAIILYQILAWDGAGAKDNTADR